MSRPKCAEVATFVMARPAFLVALTLFVGGHTAFAGNIDPMNTGQHFAYGENVGWINFKPSQGPGVTVTGYALTGFAWGENIGWINLSPVDGGVANDGQGDLSGFAWGENVGWINFAPTGAGVHITPDGRFIGKAWGENIGWISFNGAGFGVTTSWRFMLVPTLTPWGIALAALVLLVLGLASIHPLTKRGGRTRGMTFTRLQENSAPQTLKAWAPV
jgi:hypothetical protein